MADEIPTAAVKAGAEALLRVFKECATVDFEREARAVLAAALSHLDEVQAVQRVRELHKPDVPPEGHVWVSGDGRTPHCAGCECGDPFLDPDWPCDTIRALEGTTE